MPKISRSFFLYFDQGIVSLSTFLMQFLIAHSLGASEYGAFSVALIFIMFLSNIYWAILTQPTIIKLADQEAEKGWLGFYSSLISLHVVWFAICAMLIVIFCIYYKLDFLTACASFSYLIFYQIYDFSRRLLIAGDGLRRAFYCDVALAVMSFLLISLLSYLRSDVSGYYAVLSIAYAFVVVFLAFKMPKVTLRVSDESLIVIASDLFGLGKWLFLTVIVMWGAGQLFPFFIASSLGLAMAGKFFALRSIINIISVPIQAVNNYYPARLVAAKNKSMDLYLAQVKKMKSVIFLFGGLMFLFSFAVPFVFSELYGGGYELDYWVVFFMSISGVITILTSAYNVLLMSLNGLRVVFASYAFSALFVLISANFFINNYGALGVSICAAISALMVLMIQFLYCKKLQD